MLRSSAVSGGLTLVLGALMAGCQPAEAGAGSEPERLNPLIALHEADEPVFGVYAPGPGGGRPRGDQPSPPVKTPEERAAETVAYTEGDYIFDGSMEGGVDRALAPWAGYVDALRAAGANAHAYPLMAKTAKISDDPALAQREIARQLDTGVSGIVFVEVESADELQTGLDAMRFASDGGTRPDAVGSAPAYWGLSEDEYRERADLWPLDPDGELTSWVIVESLEGLENLEEIASVPGIGVLFPGAGTLRGVFSTTNEDGERQLDEEAWENAIMQVLAACRAHDIPCGYPANASDIETRMQQGFSVFVMGWNEGGFETVEIGRRVAGR